MIFRVEKDFTGRTSQGEAGFHKGQMLDIEEAKAEPLVTDGKLAKVTTCPHCHEYAWWVTTRAELVCGICHPPAGSFFFKRWLGGRKDACKDGRREA